MLSSSQHAGDVVEAAKWMEEARILDTADRFVNCKCVKYFFRVNQVEHGIDIASLFTRVSIINQVLEALLHRRALYARSPSHHQKGGAPGCISLAVSFVVDGTASALFPYLNGATNCSLLFLRSSDIWGVSCI